MKYSIRQHPTNQPSPKTKQKDFDDQGSPCYFHITDLGGEIDDSQEASEAIENLQNGFDRLIVQSINESHTEAKEVLDVLANTFAVFSMGANPVKVKIEAMLYKTKEQDHFLDFLYSYQNQLRGTIQSVDRVVIYFIYIDQYMKLRINGINVSESSKNEDMVTLTLDCIGYSFGRFAPTEIMERAPKTADSPSLALNMEPEIEFISSNYA
ncbi:MAG: hypothetical protein ACOC1X_03405 [Promethearchaeota archaeon]